jgi:hypothetical protein
MSIRNMLLVDKYHELENRYQFHKGTKYVRGMHGSYPMYVYKIGPYFIREDKWGIHNGSYLIVTKDSDYWNNKEGKDGGIKALGIIIDYNDSAPRAGEILELIEKYPDMFNVIYENEAGIKPSCFHSMNHFPLWDLYYLEATLKGEKPYES